MSEIGSAQWIEALAEIGRRLGQAVARDLERIERMATPFVEACRKAYREAGAPYGDTDDGMLRWISDCRAKADAQWRREREESIRETCEMLRRSRVR